MADYSFFHKWTVGDATWDTLKGGDVELLRFAYTWPKFAHFGGEDSGIGGGVVRSEIPGARKSIEGP
jgi:hypothetical protein